jgi:sugar phosphate isomerase/epimerase
MREIVIPTFYDLSQPISGALEQLAGAGVRLVELLADLPDSHIDMSDEAAVDALARTVSRLPLDVYSVHCGFSHPSEEAWDISQPDEDKRAGAVRTCGEVIRASARLGAHHVVIHPGVREPGEERLALSRRSLAELTATAREAGTRIAVENLPPDHLGGSLAEMERLLDGMDAAVVGFCLDTGHAMLGGDRIGDYVRSLGDRMFGVHWHGNDNSEDIHLFPDAARPEWDGFFAALDEVGYNAPVTIEAVPPPTMPLAEALRSVRSALQGERTARPA